MLKAKPVWFSLDVFKADPGGYSAARAARALERAFTGRAVTREYTEPRPIRYTRDRIAVRGDTSTNTRLIGIRPRLISGRVSQSGRSVTSRM